MKPTLTILLTALPVIVLLQIAALLFDLYQYRLVGAGLVFFTAATLTLGLFAWHDYALWPLQRRAPHRYAALGIGLALGLVALFVTTQSGAPFAQAIGTMVYVGAGLLGAACGQFIGLRLTSVSL